MAKSVSLTENAIQKAFRDVAEAGGRRDIIDAKEPGLHLRVSAPSRRTAKGQGRWTLSMRDREGRLRRFQLGAWPTMGISDAREAARSLRSKVRQDGADPVAERRKTRLMGAAAREGVGTLRALLELYGGPVTPGEDGRRNVAIGPGKELRSWSEQRRRIEHVFAHHLDRPVAALALDDLQATADSHPSAQSAAAATRYLRPIVKWASARGRGLASRELSLLEPPATPKRRNRVLKASELAALIPVLLATNDPHEMAQLFLLYTLTRREEAGAAQWGDIDLDSGVWHLDKTKTGQPHSIPLSRQAQALLHRIGPGKKRELVFATRTGGRLSNWDRATKNLMAQTGTSGWHRHDLRRTGATLMGQLDVAPHIVEAGLNHANIHSPLAALYNQARYRGEVEAALQLLADHLHTFAAQTDSGDAVVLAEAAP